MKLRIAFIGLVCGVVLCPGLILAQNVQLEYSTYLGGSGNDEASGMVVDADGNVYVGGGTWSADFPTANPYQSSFGGGDAFVSKLSSTGTTLVYSTYLGGSSSDSGAGLALGSDNNVFLTGTTLSSNFPTVNPYQSSSAGGGDSFVSQLSSTGTTLVYSTYLGGSKGDQGAGLVIDSQNQVYLTGSTSSDSDFPLQNPYQSSFGGGFNDTFVTSLSSTGTSLVYSTYLGGSHNDWGQGITLDSSNRAYVSGCTSSTDFPLQNPYQSSFSGFTSNVFVSKFSSTGTSLVYSTYLGGGEDYSYSPVSLDSQNQAWITGTTYTTDFPTANPYQSTLGGGSSDAFISKLSSTGTTLVYSTYLGGDGEEQGNQITTDSAGRTYLTGYTSSSSGFPLVNPYQSSFGGDYDSFVTSLSSTGTSLIYSTYLGGSGYDSGSLLALDSANRAYVSGYTDSTDFPTVNPYQSTWSEGAAGKGNSTMDIFISRLNSPSSRRYVFDSGDYNGDGTADIGIFRDTSGLWAIRGVTRIYFGSSGDQTVPGDYNGNGTSEIGIFRETSGLWAIRDLTRLYFGTSDDQPVPGDFDGNAQGEPGIFRDTSGLWAIRGLTRLYFGGSSDWPVPGDFSGSGTSDIGIFRETSGLWAIRGVTRLYFGSLSDWPVPGDFSGTGTSDIGIFRETSGLWAIRGVTRAYFGAGPDQPVPADYDGNSRDDIGIFRDTSGLWAIRGITRAYFGSSGDIPVTR